MAKSGCRRNRPLRTLPDKNWGSKPHGHRRHAASGLRLDRADEFSPRWSWDDPDRAAIRRAERDALREELY